MNPTTAAEWAREVLKSYTMFPVRDNKETLLDLIEKACEGYARQQVAAFRPLVKVIQGFLQEPTIKDTVRSMRAMDMLFAEEVPQYREDCESLQHAADAVDEALAAAIRVLP